MTTKAITGYRLKDGKLVKKPPRMAPVLASAKHKQAARKAKQWAAKSKPTIAWMKENVSPEEMIDFLAGKPKGTET